MSDNGKLIITRKPHICANCGAEIPKGSDAIFCSWRAPKYDDNDDQIGIEYVKLWICEKDCHSDDYNNENNIKKDKL